MQDLNEAKKYVKQNAELMHLVISDTELDIFAHDFVNVFQLLDLVKDADTNDIDAMANPFEYMRNLKIIK